MRGTLRRQSADTWQLRIFRGRDDHGRQLFDYHTIEARTKREAEAAQRQLMHALDTGGYAEPSRLTVEEYMKSWLKDHVAKAVSPYTFDRYSTIVHKHLIPAFGPIRLTQLAPVRIEAYYSAALEHGRVRAVSRKSSDGTTETVSEGLDPATVLYHHRVLSSALKRAVRLGLLVANPCDRVEAPKKARPQMMALDEQETERMLAAARRASTASLYAAILLAANTGMRRGEVLGLRWSDVDFERWSLTVGRSLQVSSTGLAFKEPKTPLSRRVLALDPGTVAELKSYRKEQTERRLALGEVWQDNDLVCPGHLGQPWRPDSFKSAYRRFVRDHGFTIGFHGLRHSHASQLIRAGAPAKVVQERLGHASAGFTLTVYGHVLPGMQAEAVQRLADARAAARAALEAIEKNA